MFDVTADDIACLDDVTLRELVGRLCEAELVSLGLSASAVTWGGNQTAADGGLDVRVSLTSDAFVSGFIPRPSTGFQVKVPDMPRSEILAEMCPFGALRPVIRDLTDESGAYVIVASRGSVADGALSRRNDAMREALGHTSKSEQLHTDFYDRTRLASWVRCHPGLITWVKEKTGQAVRGWRSYGSWSGQAEAEDAEYLLDERLRLHLCADRRQKPKALVQALDELRDGLSRPGSVIRLVGLSGVGKTRLAEALFDPRVGARPLPPSLAIYTNLSDDPDPLPTGLASDLIVKRHRAVLVVDNCTPDLHRRLSELCSAPGSSLSLLSIEYDIREDQPEGTQVITLEASSPELMERLLRRRFPNLSGVDTRTIADASGGNARIAIAIAATVGDTESVAGLSDDELFQRLFRQRHEHDNALLLAAQAFSLVYSFNGETMTGDMAELSRLAEIAGQTVGEVYRHASELLRRNLMQQRGVWRALLPHAIANRLALRALQDFHPALVSELLVTGGTDRLKRSFSRRLSYLHDQPQAVSIANNWLSRDGILADVTALDEVGWAMFENVAPVLPDAALGALERAIDVDYEIAIKLLAERRELLRSLAYDPALFERVCDLLIHAAVTSSADTKTQTAGTFTSMFTIYFSGTHATVEQRLIAIEKLMRSQEERRQCLGLAALGEMLETVHFSSSFSFGFGARSRDYGFEPRNCDEVAHWFRSALALVERFLLDEEIFTEQLADLLAAKISRFMDINRASRRVKASLS